MELIQSYTTSLTHDKRGQNKGISGTLRLMENQCSYFPPTSSIQRNLITVKVRLHIRDEFLINDLFRTVVNKS